MSRKGGPAALIALGDLGPASERVICVHEASADVLGARIDAQRLLVPIHRLLRIVSLTLPRGSRDLPQQAAAKRVGESRGLRQLDLLTVEERAAVEIDGLSETL